MEVFNQFKNRILKNVCSSEKLWEYIYHVLYKGKLFLKLFYLVLQSGQKFCYTENDMLYYNLWIGEFLRQRCQNCVLTDFSFTDLLCKEKKSMPQK